MKIKDETLWNDVLKKNTDPYSLGVITYLERWGNLMEEELEKGNSIEDIAHETSHIADTEGVTGFMYGIAVAILADVWEHGEQLRVWHNKQYGIEGEKGTVNPAVLTLRMKE